VLGGNFVVERVDSQPAPAAPSRLRPAQGRRRRPPARRSPTARQGRPARRRRRAAPAIDTLLEEASYAYRRGFSRQGAARAIERAYAEGYRYVLDADVRAFFDRVVWSILFAKLDALYPHEPLVELLRLWVTAPVLFSGRRIDRDRGLPQGSPVSPLLANLYLDTFDEELLDQGFRLVRFADDFVVLAKDPSKAPCRPLF
jgi:CRISPR-associated protein Cas1